MTVPETLASNENVELNYDLSNKLINTKFFETNKSFKNLTNQDKNKVNEKKVVIEGKDDPTDLIEKQLIYDTFLKGMFDLINLNGQENDDSIENKKLYKIEEIAQMFSDKAVILYSDNNGYVHEIKDIKKFLKDVADLKMSVDLDIDTEQYVNEGAIKLDSDKKIKEIVLNCNYLDVYTND